MNMSAVPPITDSLSATPGCPLCANFSHRILRGTVSRQIKEDRERTERLIADTEYLAREIAALRIGLGEVVTRDYLRRELRALLEDLERDEA